MRDAHGGPSADSAGVPWSGRRFEPTGFGSDDGSAPPELAAAASAFRDGTGSQEAVVDAVRDARLLVPLIAEVGETELGNHGLRADKRAELSLVSVAGPDGRPVLPVFSSSEAMRVWNPRARPIPVEARRAALAAAAEGTDLVVLDPSSDSEFVLRRSAIQSIATGAGWMPPHLDPAVQALVDASVGGEHVVVSVTIESGDPTARLRGPELTVVVALAPGLDAEALGALVARLRDRWASSPALAAVDSIGVRIRPA